MDRWKEWSNIRSGSHSLSLRVDHDPQKFQCSPQMPIYKECPRQLDLRWPTTHTALADQMIKVWPNVENCLLKSSKLFLQAFDSLWGDKRFCEFPATTNLTGVSGFTNAMQCMWRAIFYLGRIRYKYILVIKFHHPIKFFIGLKSDHCLALSVS